MSTHAGTAAGCFHLPPVNPTHSTRCLPASVRTHLPSPPASTRCPVRAKAAPRSRKCRPCRWSHPLHSRAATAAAAGSLRTKAQRTDSPTPATSEQQQQEQERREQEFGPLSADQGSLSDDLSKGVAKAVKKTATTFAPRASTKTKNPAVPGSALYRIFEVQGYACLALGGLLSFNLLFPSDEPDIWRLMGMWSIWMFTIPSLRARDCSEREKTALNYLFLVIPLVNVTLPIFWKSFAAVWTADVITFVAFYAWKMDWLKTGSSSSSSGSSE